MRGQAVKYCFLKGGVSYKRSLDTMLHTISDTINIVL